MSGACFRSFLALGLTGLTTLAVAQAKKAPPQKFAVPGSPDSVSVGSKDGRPVARSRRAAEAKGHAGAAVATFPGFRLLPDGQSRIYVELTQSVSVDERRADGMLIYVIHGARVPVRNNRNALITTHFATPVARARLLSAGGDVELVIDLRKAVSATQKVVAGENGSARLEVDFPAGDYPPVPGLFEPPAAKDQRTQETGEPEATDRKSAPEVAPPTASAGASRGAALPAGAPRPAPSGNSAPAPPAR